MFQSFNNFNNKQEIIYKFYHIAFLLYDFKSSRDQIRTIWHDTCALFYDFLFFMALVKLSTSEQVNHILRRITISQMNLIFWFMPKQYPFEKTFVSLYGT